MARYEDLVELWGEENICRLLAETLEGIDVPEGAQAVLTQVGLPIHLDALFETNLCRDGRGPISVAAPRQQGRWYRIGGADDGTDICVGSELGTVLAIDPEGELPDCFVNSSLEAYITFLYLVDRFRTAFADRSEDEFYAAVGMVKGELSAIDPQAFADPKHWWAEYIGEWEFWAEDVDDEDDEVL